MTTTIQGFIIKVDIDYNTRKASALFHTNVGKIFIEDFNYYQAKKIEWYQYQIPPIFVELKWINCRFIVKQLEDCKGCTK